MNTKNTSIDHQGGCMCGEIRYTIHGDPDWSAHCHCRSCQKSTGAAFTTWVGLKTGTVCNTSPGVERGFCSHCGTSLTYVAEEGFPGQISVLAPTLDNPQIASPKCHVFVDDQIAWIKLNDGLPTNNQS
jgi:hypothetical protein